MTDDWVRGWINSDQQCDVCSATIHQNDKGWVSTQRGGIFHHNECHTNEDRMMYRMRIDDDDGLVLTLYQVAEPGTTFAAADLTNWHGRPVPVKLPLGGSLLGYVESAEVIDDGRAIAVRVRLPRNEPEHPNMQENHARTPGDA